MKNNKLDILYNELLNEYKSKLVLLKKGLIISDEIEEIEDKLIEIECLSGI